MRRSILFSARQKPAHFRFHVGRDDAHLGPSLFRRVVVVLNEFSFELDACSRDLGGESLR